MRPRTDRSIGCRDLPARRGAALLFIVVLLFVTSLMLVTLTQGVIRQHRQQLHERDRWQAEFCADAALDRLKKVLQETPAAASHTWTTAPDSARPEVTAVVTAEMETLPEGRRVTVLAEYPAGSTHRIRIRRVVVWPLSAATTPPVMETQPVSALILENVR